MSLHYFIALTLNITCMIYLVLGINTFISDTKSHMRRLYVITCICLALWSFSYSLMTLTHSEDLARLFWSFGFFATILFFPSWTSFLYHFTSQKWRKSKQIMFLLYFCGFIIALTTIFSDSIEFIQTDLGFQFTYEASPIFIVVHAYIMIIFALMLYMQVQWMRSARLVRKKKTAFIFLLSTLIVLPPAHILEGIIPIYLNSSAVPFATVLLLLVSLQFYRAARTNKALDINIQNVSQDVFTSITMPVLVLNHNNEVVLANNATKQLWKSDIIGSNAADLFFIGDNKPEASFFDENLESTRISINTAAKDIHCNLLLSVVKDIYGDVLNKIITVSDITELLDAIDKADQASKAKSNFLANMSHEVRTPLNAIIGMTELALRENIDTVSREYLKTIKQAGSNLLSIVNDILDFSKIETGKMDIVSAEYSTSSLINDVVGTIRMRTLDLPIQFFVNVDKDIPHTLIGDEMKIRQILINVLDNAVKYTDQGFVYLSMSSEFSQDGTVSLIAKVSDSGKGIKSEHLDALFEDFARFDTESNRSVEGMGLGLAITKTLIDVMKGNISVESEYGKGSTFTVKLPQEYTSRAPLATIADSESMNVLIYERFEQASDSIADTFSNLGIKYAVTSTVSGLRKIMSEQRFDFVFVSYHLYKQCEELIAQHKGNAKIVLFIEYHETISESILNNDVKVMVLPAYCIPIANIINGMSSEASYDSTKKLVVSFTAPAADVLIVDDIKTNLKVAKGLLQPYNMEIDLCNSGREAIEALKRKNYDIVFMDHKMPDMDGVETTQHIREMGMRNSYYKDIPIVALTANAIAGASEMFLANGFDDFLSKPIDVVELDRVLEKWIPKHKQKKIAEKSDTSADSRNGKTAITGLNIDLGLSRTGGTMEFYREMLAVFCEDGYAKITELKECLEVGDIALFITHVHGIKSAAAFIGANELSAAAGVLEDAGREGNLEFLKLNTDEFLQSLENLLGNIREEIF